MTSRRDFIKVTSLAGGGLMMSVALPFDIKNEKSSYIAKANKIELNKFLSIDTNGQITIMLTKHEMGQGTGTAVPTILADELGADWSKVVIKRSDYDPNYSWPEMGTTGGSGSISRIWDSIRNAGATAREMLRQAAANKWGIDTIAVEMRNSFAFNSGTDEKLEFGALAQEASKLPIPEEVRLKDLKDYVYIGQPVKNRITKDVISGKASYGIDMELPNMVYASIEKCPVYKGKLKSFDDTEAKKVTGVIDIFPFAHTDEMKPPVHPKRGYTGEGVVVIADSTWTTFKARKLLKIEWYGGEHAGRSSNSMQKEMDTVKNSADIVFEIGNVSEGFNDEHNRILEVEYNNPHQAHALMEPINATAHFQGDACHVWVGAQDPGVINEEVANVVGLPSEKVTVHILNSGGSFGRRYHADSSIEAAFISKKINRPVKVTWTREDEIMHDHFHPYLRNYLKAAITPKGAVKSFENIAICTVEYSSWSNKWNHYYSFPNIRCFLTTIPTPIAQGAWRSTGQHSANLAKECFIDEIAVKISKDQVDYRLQLLSHEVDFGDLTNLPPWVKKSKRIIRERHIEVLKFVKSSGLWDNSSVVGSGKGFAISNFGKTVCAEIAEVTMDDSECGFTVNKITAIVHCGMVINPHFGKGQIEGSIIWALSTLLYGGLEIENGVVQRNNFHNNKVLRIDESPKIEVHFIESDERPTGLGEPGVPPLAPAVLNAIFNACGKRIRKIPVTKEVIDKAEQL